MHRDGPQPRRDCSPLIATRCYCDFGQGNTSSGPSQSQSADTTDTRVGVDGDNATVIKDSTSGAITITGVDGDVATNALNVASDLGESAADLGDNAASLGSDALNAATDLNADANATTLSLAAGALAALKTLVESNEKVAANALAGAGQIASNSLNAASAAGSDASARAAQVADAQSKFLATQTGQGSLVQVIKYGAIAAGVMVLGGVAYAAMAGRKKAA